MSTNLLSSPVNTLAVPLHQFPRTQRWKVRTLGGVPRPKIFLFRSSA